MSEEDKKMKRMMYFDINKMLFAIANDLDTILLLLLIECFELVFFLPIIDRTNDNL
jgi:hypothetical protein